MQVSNLESLSEKSAPYRGRAYRKTLVTSYEFNFTINLFRMTSRACHTNESLV